MYPKHNTPPRASSRRFRSSLSIQPPRLLILRRSLLLQPLLLLFFLLFGQWYEVTESKGCKVAFHFAILRARDLWKADMLGSSIQSSRPVGPIALFCRMDSSPLSVPFLFFPFLFFTVGLDWSSDSSKSLSVVRSTSGLPLFGPLTVKILSPLDVAPSSSSSSMSFADLTGEEVVEVELRCFSARD